MDPRGGSSLFRVTLLGKHSFREREGKSSSQGLFRYLIGTRLMKLKGIVEYFGQYRLLQDLSPWAFSVPIRSPRPQPLHYGFCRILVCTQWKECKFFKLYCFNCKFLIPNGEVKRYCICDSSCLYILLVLILTTSQTWLNLWNNVAENV